MTDELILLGFFGFVVLVLIWQIKGVRNYNRQVEAGVRAIGLEYQKRKRWMPIFVSVEPKAEGQWICQYCHSANPNSKFQCGHCGASKGYKIY